MFEMDEQTYEDFVVKYRHAMNVARGEIENLIEDLEREKGRAVVYVFKDRIKKRLSLCEKCERKGLSPEEIEDVAGIKVVFLYVDDAFEFSKRIDDAFFVKAEDDYYAHPKDNGYRGIHKTIDVRTTVNQKRVRACVEVQIKTALMDALWSMEHEVRYKAKKPAPAAQDIIKKSADNIAELETDMISFRDYTED